MVMATRTMHAGGKRVIFFSDTSAALLTVTAPAGKYKFLWAGITYSAAPTYAALATHVGVNSALGAAYDHRFFEGAANDQFVFFEGGDHVVLEDGDQPFVTAADAGGVITSTITLCCEVLE